MLKVILCIMILFAVTGCNYMGAIATIASGPRTNPAVFPLPSHRTLVFIDDPRESFTNPQMKTVIASQIVFQLKDNEVLAADQVVDLAELRAIQNELDDDFEKTAIDRIGRMVEADQVLYVRINAVAIRQQDTLYRPAASLDVTVIDAFERKRLFPPTHEFVTGATAQGQAPPAYRMTVTMEYDGVDTSLTSRSSDIAARQKLAEKIGLDVARLFYDWKDDEPGEVFAPDV